MMLFRIKKTCLTAKKTTFYWHPKYLYQLSPEKQTHFITVSIKAKY
jgi:hypothetical protein